MRRLSLIIISIIFSVRLFGDIGGVVFKDFNLNGVKDSEDSGISNISIKATCDDGRSYSTTTKVDGSYRVSLPAKINRCRLEAEPQNVGFGAGENGAKGATASSLVSFSTNGNLRHNISIASPATYCQDKPDVLMTALPGGNDGGCAEPEKHGSLFSLPTPEIGVYDTDYTKRTLLQKRANLGAVWGLAYRKDTKTVYVSSVIKRYIPLLHNNCSDEDKFKNGCAGVIYKITDSGAGSVSVLTSLSNSEVGYSLTQKRDYNGDSDQNDSEVVELVGRAGLGDLDISEDGKYLYTINLYKKQLITIDSESGRIISKVNIPNPYGKKCSNESVRPWALKVLGKDVFIGSVCEDKISNGYPTDRDTDHSSELGAVIQKFDGSSFTIFAQTNTLNYLKPRTYEPEKAEAPEYDQNSNWDDEDYRWFLQPMLTDIEFTNSGDLILGYTDRGAFNKERGNSSGDVRKMCRNSDGTYTDESTSVAPTDCLSHTVEYLNSNQDNTQIYYEFYRGDYFDYNGTLIKSYGYGGHPETASGALAMRPGDSYIYVGMVDGTKSYEPGSLGFYDNKNGDKVAAQALINNISIADSPNGEREMYGSKAGGMGDIELICEPAPIELGDYVWSDIDGNGIQDPTELGIANVQVELHLGSSCNGKLIGKTTTNSDGYYYFGGLGSVNLKSGYKVEPNTKYSICIPLNDQSILNMKITAKDAGINDEIDSDIIDDGDGYAKISVLTKEYGNNNHSLDAGFTLASIGDLVWYDKNHNGIQDSKEDGVGGVRVELYDSSTNKKIKTAVTDPTGKYLFLGLDVGDYYVKFDLNSIPPGYKVTTKNANSNSDDSIDSDADPVTGKSEVISLDAGERDLSWDMGIYKPTYCLGDFIWEDSNKNGIQESGESGVEGVLVTLNETGATTTTDSSGKYSFCNLNEGNYSITVTPPAGYLISPQNQGGDDTKDSDVNPQTHKSDRVWIDGENNSSLDVGIYKKEAPTYCLGDFIWDDKNQNGIQDLGEGGVSGVKVTLIQTGKSITTGADGKYLFCGLSSGDYSIRVEPPAGYTISPQNQGSDEAKDSDINPNTKESSIVSISDSNVTTLDVGLYKPCVTTYCLGDFIWNDKNKNGIQDSDESGIAGAKVTLIQTNQTLITGDDGKYFFCGLSSGDYSIRVEPPAGYAISPQNQGGDEAKDSDVNPNTKESDTVSISDSNVTTLDCGVYENIVHTYSIGDFVWEDSNKNGIQDSGESGIPNIEVKLFNSSGILIGATKTDNYGKYRFDNLLNGTYKVEFKVPSTYTVTAINAGDDNKDSDANANGVVDSVVVKDSDNLSIDMGLYPNSPESPSPLLSKNPKIDIEKYLNDKDADEESQAVPLVEGDKITWKYVISNIGDETITDIKVVDDKEGAVNCPKTTLAPATKMTCTKSGSAKDSKYHNIATVTGRGLSSGKSVSDSDDSWYVTKYLIGTHFWIDTNKDGIYQEGIEKPIPNALVELFDANGNKVAETVTNEKGEYHFYVDAGSYYVRFHLPEEFKKQGYIFESPKGNSDNNLNINNTNEDGFTKLVTVGPNADPKHQLEDLTLDAAINCGCDTPEIDKGEGVGSFDKIFGFIFTILSLLLGFRRVQRV